jgi:hypothetical protein
MEGVVIGAVVGAFVGWLIIAVLRARNIPVINLMVGDLGALLLWPQ